jgi:hypothetical protein
MREHGCGLEQDVLDAVRTGRWPHRCEASLVSHARTCAVCADLAVVAAAFGDAMEDEGDVPPLPLPGAIWWRAQRQARLDAARRVALPMRLAHAAAIVCAVAIVAAFGGMAIGWIGDTIGALELSLPQLPLAMDSLDRLWAPARLGLLLGAIVICVLAPAAIYVTLSDPERHDRAR